MALLKRRISFATGHKPVWLFFGLGLLLVVGALYPELSANLDRIRVIRGLDIGEWTPSADEVAWDAGWRSLCASGQPKAADTAPTGRRALPFAALASIDRGDYAGGLTQFEELVTQGNTVEAANAPAYLAALKLDWVGAARAYRPPATTRHQRFWATVFYLAAQQLMFAGHADQAAEFYRHADAGYGVLGPYRGLALVECLSRRERHAEAFDAYRRALVKLPPEEALEHLSRFNALRLAGLRDWHEQDPENSQVAHWLAFYEADKPVDLPNAEIQAQPSAPQIVLEQKLDDRRSLVGLDYRTEDIQTGPFMRVAFYLRTDTGQGDDQVKIEHTVVNQAPNGAVSWDVPPDGVRPIGWHVLLYSHDLSALHYTAVTGDRRWLCLDGGSIGASFGLESDTTGVISDTVSYVQGGQAFVSREGALGHGRTWFDYSETV